jgi:uncharacterized protein (TIGR03435 family)
MPKKFLLKISFALAIPIACAQNFEVASVRASAPYDPVRGQVFILQGGPGTDTPEMLRVENVNLKIIVGDAYGMPYYRVVTPDWMQSAQFDIRARVPKGITKQDFLKMKQNLLAERFGLKMHFEKKEMSLYELSIGKGGIKFPEAGVAPPKPDDDAPKPRSTADFKRDADGYPVLAGVGMAAGYGKARAMYKNAPMERLVNLLSAQLNAPVTDLTGLSSKYDFLLSWAMDNERAGSTNGSTPLAGATDPGGPTLEQAVLLQLGLKLEKKKGPVDIVVVDDAQKTPTEN